MANVTVEALHPETVNVVHQAVPVNQDQEVHRRTETEAAAAVPGSVDADLKWR